VSHPPAATAARRVFWILLLMFMLSGCHSPDIRLNQPHNRTLSATGPTVLDLVDHISCELARTYEENTALTTDLPTMDESAAQHNERWSRLLVNNFVASIDLTLTVTRNEGFNPSLNYIWPLTGAAIASPTPSIRGWVRPWGPTTTRWRSACS